MRRRVEQTPKYQTLQTVIYKRARTELNFGDSIEARKRLNLAVQHVLDLAVDGREDELAQAAIDYLKAL